MPLTKQVIMAGRYAVGHEGLRHACFRREGAILGNDRGCRGGFHQLVPGFHHHPRVHALAVPQALDLTLRGRQSCFDLACCIPVKLRDTALTRASLMRNCFQSGCIAKALRSYEGFPTGLQRTTMCCAASHGQRLL